MFDSCTPTPTTPRSRPGKNVVQRVRFAVLCCIACSDLRVDLGRQRECPRRTARTTPKGQSLVVRSPRLRAPPRRYNHRRHNHRHLHRCSDSLPVVLNNNNRLPLRHRSSANPRVAPSKRPEHRYSVNLLVPVPLSSNNQRRRSLANRRVVLSSSNLPLLCLLSLQLGYNNNHLPLFLASLRLGLNNHRNRLRLCLVSLQPGLSSSNLR